MKAILYIVAIVAIGGAAFFSINHKGKFEKLQADRLKTSQDSTTTTNLAVAEEKELANERTPLTKAEDAEQFIINEISTLKSTGAALQRDVSGKDDELKVQEDEFKALENTLAEVNTILSDLGGNVTLDALPAKIEEIQNDLKAKQTKLEETTTLITGAEKALATTRAEQDRLMKRISERSARIVKNAKESTVTAVNQDWGFVVIGAGSNSNFTPQTPLLVERDGRFIGRVKPSAVEATQTIAEIDFESLAPGVRIQPGDRVILQNPAAN